MFDDVAYMVHAKSIIMPPINASLYLLCKSAKLPANGLQIMEHTFISPPASPIIAPPAPMVFAKPVISGVVIIGHAIKQKLATITNKKSFLY